MPPRVQALLASPLVVVAFVMSLGVSLWVQPLTWQVKPSAAGIAVFLLLTVAGMALPAGMYGLVTGAFRHRPVAWDSDPAGRRFSARCSPRQAVRMIVWGGFAARIIPVERVPDQDRARIAQLGVTTTVFIVIAVVLLIDMVVRSVTSRPSIELSPEGISVRRRVRWKKISWTELVPGGPPRPEKRRPAVIELRRSAAAPGQRSRRLVLPAGGLHVDTAFLAYTIRWYVGHPDRRVRIGDAVELKELQQGFAAEDETPRTPPASGMAR